MAELKSKKTITGRILWLVEHCKKKNLYGIQYDKDFIRVCGLPHSSFLSDLRSGKNKNPSYVIVWGIVKNIGANPDWLAFGDGDPFSNPRYNQKSIHRQLQSIRKQIDECLNQTA